MVSLRRYYDLGVAPNIDLENQSREDIKNRISEFLSMANKLDLHAISFLYPFSTPSQADKLKEIIDEISENHNIEIYLSALFTSPPSPSSSSNYRKKGILVTYEGESIKEVADKGSADIIIPSLTSLTYSKDINQTLINMLKNSITAIAIPLIPFLSLSKYQQIQVLNLLNLIHRLYDKYDFPLIVISYARTPCQMRAGRDLSSLSYSINPHLEYALNTTSTNPERIVNKISLLSDKKRKAPGVYEM